MWPRGTVGGVLGTERGSCRRTPGDRRRKPAAPLVRCRARQVGRSDFRERAQGQGGGPGGPGRGTPRPRQGEDPDRRAGAELRSGHEPPPLRPTPPGCIPRAALAATLPQQGPRGSPGPPPALLSCRPERPGEADSKKGRRESGVSPGLRPRSADPGFCRAAPRPAGPGLGSGARAAGPASDGGGRTGAGGRGGARDKGRGKSCRAPRPRGELGYRSPPRARGKSLRGYGWVDRGTFPAPIAGRLQSVEVQPEGA